MFASSEAWLKVIAFSCGTMSIWHFTGDAWYSNMDGCDDDMCCISVVDFLNSFATYPALLARFLIDAPDVATSSSPEARWRWTCWHSSPWLNSEHSEVGAERVSYLHEHRIRMILLAKRCRRWNKIRVIHPMHARHCCGSGWMKIPHLCMHSWSFSLRRGGWKAR